MYLPLGWMPAVARAIYALTFGLDLCWQSNWIVCLLTMPAGFVLFVIAWVRVMRRERLTTISEAGRAPSRR